MLFGTWNKNWYISNQEITLIYPHCSSPPRMAVYLKHISSRGPCHHALLISLYCITAIGCIGCYEFTIHHSGVFEIWNTNMNFVSDALPSISLSHLYWSMSAKSHGRAGLMYKSPFPPSWWSLPESSCCSLTYNACIINLYGMIFRHIDNVCVAISAVKYSYGISHINNGIATISITNIRWPVWCLGGNIPGELGQYHTILYLLMSGVRASSLKLDIGSVK